MNQFLLAQENSAQLNQFAHIIEFAIKRNTAFQLISLNEGSTNSLRIYYSLERKFEWTVNAEHYILYPSNLPAGRQGHKAHSGKTFLITNQND